MGILVEMINYPAELIIFFSVGMWKQGRGSALCSSLFILILQGEKGGFAIRQLCMYLSTCYPERVALWFLNNLLEQKVPL